MTLLIDAPLTAVSTTTVCSAVIMTLVNYQLTLPVNPPCLSMISPDILRLTLSLNQHYAPQTTAFETASAQKRCYSDLSQYTRATQVRSSLILTPAWFHLHRRISDMNPSVLQLNTNQTLCLRFHNLVMLWRVLPDRNDDRLPRPPTTFPLQHHRTDVPGFHFQNRRVSLRTVHVECRRRSSIYTKSADPQLPKLSQSNTTRSLYSPSSRNSPLHWDATRQAWFTLEPARTFNNWEYMITHLIKVL